MWQEAGPFVNKGSLRKIPPPILRKVVTQIRDAKSSVVSSLLGAQILDSLGVPPELRTGRAALRFGGLKGGTAFPAQEPPVLFPKKV